MRRCITIILFLTVSFLFLAAPHICYPIEPKMRCEDIKTLSFKDVRFNKEIAIDSAVIVKGDEEQPDHCLVKGKIWPDDAFIVKMPTDWNGRLYQTGNSGAAGLINEKDMERPLKRGYVTTSGSGGHVGSSIVDWSFGDPPTDPIAKIKIEEFFYGSVHRVNRFTRQLIRAYYGQRPSYAYYDGYSTGGRQGLMEAQIYPLDFDGILAGGAPIPWTKRTMADTWAATQFLGDSYVSRSKLPILADTVMNQCDEIDGSKDGLIEDPRRCTFNALTDLPACPEDVDGPQCFTKKQRQAIFNIYDGVRDSNGRLLFKGASLSSEAIMADGKSGWEMMVPSSPGGSDTLSLGLGSGFVKTIGLPPEKGGPDWDWKAFDVDTDWVIVSKKWEKYDTYNPDLNKFRRKGGKLIYYHGWADALCWPNPGVDYYEMVAKRTGGINRAQGFFKLYMVPGMNHLPGGRGVFESFSIRPVLFDMLVDWVEKKKKPGPIIGQRPANPQRGWDAISRPVCPYPEVAKYKGDGNMGDAANFICAAP